MAIKIDMSKAYDQMEWSIVDSMTDKCGFSSKWRRWIMSCMSSMTYNILVNGSLGPYISPSRGVRQGDLISPFLFLLCMEGLSTSIVVK